MKMKKIVTGLVLSVVAASLLSMPVFASEMIQPTDKTSNITAVVEESYTWSVPATVAFEETTANSSVDITVTVNSAVLEEGHSVFVTFTGSNNGFKLNSSVGNNDVSYTLKKGSNSVSEWETIIETSTAPTSQTLTATLNEKISVAGSYSDTLSFSAYIGN